MTNIDLRCGDCLEIMRTMPEKSVDLCLCDPPYEYISKNPQGGGFMTNNNRQHFQKISSSFGMSFNPKEFLSNLIRLMKVFNCYIWTNKNLLIEYISFAKQNNFKWDILLWLKPNPVPCQNGHYLSDKEYCIYMKKSGATFNASLGYEKYHSFNLKAIGSKTTKHPTEKPMFIKNFIEISSDKADVVFDPFMGSGTTGAAAKELGRNFIGIEIHQPYFDIAARRIANAQELMF